MNYFYQYFKNSIDFFLRNKFSFSRKNYFEEPENKDNLFSKTAQIEREKELFEKYDLYELRENSTKQNYLENLYTIDLLDKYLDVEFSNELKVLDIGCKNWFYAKGEYTFFKKNSNLLKLDGIELDPNRIYSNLYSRREVAKFYTKNTNANYIEGDFLKHKGKYDYITWFLPFVIEEPHIKWGLPKKHFSPEKMLFHAQESLEKNGKIFIINQGEEEFKAQIKLCEKLNIPHKIIGKIQSPFSNYKHDRYLTIIQKT